ncbi:MAG: beta-ketoacyl-[acyl-carrier-protein] synthase family protein [Pirellulaceae bacterium]|nr:beta-ketoacyl-[acyl-carrier-protein] synthase family protein [Pirellulaceae bacterium]
MITGIGIVASTGLDRESVWQAVQLGRSRVRRLTGMPGIPDGQILGATVDLPAETPWRLKVFPMAEMAADEAIRDARLDLNHVDRDRFACSISSHMGDSSWFEEQAGLRTAGDPDRTPWWQQFLPNTSCCMIANRCGAMGPRLSYSTACASSLICFLGAVRALRDGQCDIAIAGGADAIHPLFVAGFHKMRVLAEHEDPNQACRPYDRNRSGFVMGEGATMLVVERLSHAQRRGAKIYAQVLACRALAEAHHVTGLDADSEALSYLISSTLRSSNLRPRDVGYVNAHGTGTQQNDLVEMRSIREAFGPAADQLCVSSSKSVLGHMINAAGGTELAITLLAMRDGFAPPTMNLTDPDPELSFDCVPLVGRRNRFQNSLKLSVAFGGHLVAVALSRWNDAASGYAYPPEARVA